MNLDFVIVGAQKSGTTTLHNVMSKHPEISMPAAKEVPFFNSEGNSRTDIDAFLVDTFPIPLTKPFKVGKATPQYLPSKIAADQLAQNFPDCKVIAILRNPIERTYSHYRMCLRRERTELSFPDAVEFLLDPRNLEKARSTEHQLGENDFQYAVAYSEYGRQLQQYFQNFENEQMKVIFMSDLKAKPDEIFHDIFEFIGVESSWSSDSIGKQFHKGGTREVVNLKKIKSIPFFGPALKSVYRKLPDSFKWKVRELNVVAEEDSVFASYPEQVKILSEHFSQDFEVLKQYCDVPADWKST